LQANYFNRVEIALPGAAAFFANQSKEEAQHAQKLIDYQNDRGGKVQLMAIPVSAGFPNFYG
jgi:ferritin heavy chain